MSFAGGAAWGTDGRIVFTTGDTGLLEVSAQGGDPVPRLDVDQETEDDYHDATPLPDGRGVLFVIHRLGSGPDTIALLAGDTKNVLLQQTGESFFGPMYSPTGHILYNRATTTPGVWALPFSLSDLEVTGEPFLVAPDASWPSVSADGTLAYVPGSSFDSLQLVWVDRDGSVEGVVGQPQRSIFHPALSPNADRVAVSADENENRDVWIHDVARGTVTRLTFTDGEEWVPGWSLSGDEVTYLTAAQGDATGWSKAADGTGEARSLGITAPRGYTPDGRYLLFTERGSGTRGDVGFVDLEGDGERVMILQSAANESSGELSPDGSFLVYESDESGREEIYLTRFPSGEGRWQVSLNGGVRPRWNPSGGELFFTYETTLYAVEVELEPTVRLGTPEPLFNAALLGISVFNGYSLRPIGQLRSLTHGDTYRSYYGVPDRSRLLRLLLRGRWPGLHHHRASHTRHVQRGLRHQRERNGRRLGQRCRALGSERYRRSRPPGRELRGRSPRRQRHPAGRLRRRRESSDVPELFLGERLVHADRSVARTPGQHRRGYRLGRTDRRAVPRRGPGSA
jgi:hypothetical protein